MRLLLITTCNDRSESALFRRLASEGFEIRALLEPTAWDRDLLAQQGVTLGDIRVRHRLDLRAARELRRVLTDWPCDIIYAPRNRVLSVALLASRGMAVRCVGYRGTVGHLSRLDPAAWLTYLHPRLAGIVCVAEAVRQYLLTLGLPGRRLETIYKGFDPAWFTPAPSEDLLELGIPPGSFVVGYAANMRPNKGASILVRAMHHLRDRPDIHALLVGEVRDKAIPRLVADPAVRDRVHLPGFRQDAPALVGACQVAVMPTLRREGLCKGIIEPMAQGVPAIVTGIGGLPEIVQHGESGLVVPSGDAKALAGAIRELADDPVRRQAMSDAAAARIRNSFGVDIYVKKMRAFYERAVAQDLCYRRPFGRSDVGRSTR